jgi:type II secretion system protein N
LKPALGKAAKFVGYPLFYFGTLVLFVYLNFPFNSLKSRIVGEFDRQQKREARRSGAEPMRLSIGSLESYWFSGVQLTNARLTLKSAAKKSFRRPGSLGPSKTSEPAKKPSQIVVKQASLRLRLLPLLFGEKILDFDVDTLGGNIEGTVPIGTEGEVDVALAGIQLGKIAPLKELLQGVPVLGELSGQLELRSSQGKFSRAQGKLKLQVDNLTLGDGKSKVQGLVLPAAKAGTLMVEASAKKGLLELDTLSARGPHVELNGTGTVKLRGIWQRSLADIFIEFGFSDAYRDSSDATRTLLGKPGSKAKALIELAPQVRRAKTKDANYRFHLSGRLDRIDFRPAGKTARPAKRRGRLKRGRRRFGKKQPEASEADGTR